MLIKLSNQTHSLSKERNIHPNIQEVSRKYYSNTNITLSIAMLFESLAFADIISEVLHS